MRTLAAMLAIGLAVLGIAGEPEAPRFGDRIIGVVEYRDGTVIDVIRNVV